MGWQRGEEKGAQEGRKLRRNIYADVFISVWVPALESGKLMTLIPKLVCLELCTRPALPQRPGGPSPGPSPPVPGSRVVRVAVGRGGGRGGEEAEDGAALLT